MSFMHTSIYIYIVCVRIRLIYFAEFPPIVMCLITIC